MHHRTSGIRIQNSRFPGTLQKRQESANSSLRLHGLGRQESIKSLFRRHFIWKRSLHSLAKRSLQSPSATASRIKYNLMQNWHSLSSGQSILLEATLRTSVTAKLTNRLLLHIVKYFKGGKNGPRLVTFWSPWLLSFLTKCLLSTFAYCSLHSKAAQVGRGIRCKLATSPLLEAGWQSAGRSCGYDLSLVFQTSVPHQSPPRLTFTPRN